MTNKAKLAITLPAELADAARRAVRTGRAASVSAYVTDAVAARTRDDELIELLDAMDAENGRPGDEAQAWARQVLGV